MSTGFDLPEGATEEQRKIHKAIMSVLPHWAEPGGCRVFYTPEEWQARGEKYGEGASLVVVHDGGDHAPYFNWDYRAYPAVEAMLHALEEAGYLPSQCTSWYTAIYEK